MEYQLLRDSIAGFHLRQQRECSVVEETNRVVDIWTDYPVTIALRIPNLNSIELQESWRRYASSFRLSLRLLLDGKSIPFRKSQYPGDHQSDLVLMVTECENAGVELVSSALLSVDPRYFGHSLTFELSLKVFDSQSSQTPLESTLRKLVDTAYHGNPVPPERSWSCGVRFSFPLSFESKVREESLSSFFVTVFVHNTDSHSSLFIYDGDFQIAQLRVENDKVDDSIEGSSTPGDQFDDFSPTTGACALTDSSSQSFQTHYQSKAIMAPKNCVILPRQCKTFVFQVSSPTEDTWTAAKVVNQLGTCACPFRLLWDIDGSASPPHIVDHIVAWSREAPTLRTTSGGSKALLFRMHVPRTVKRMHAFVISIDLTNQSESDLIDVELRTSASQSDLVVFHQSSLWLGTLKAGLLRRVKISAVALTVGVCTLDSLLIVGAIAPIGESVGGGAPEKSDKNMSAASVASRWVKFKSELRTKLVVAEGE